MAQYLTHEEYIQKGGSLDAVAFPVLEMLARKRIDCFTVSRVQAMAVVPEAVKLCMMALIDMENAVGAQAQATAPVVTSFSTDGYSESHGNAFDAKTAQEQMDGLVMLFLRGESDDKGVPLLYRGVAQ